MAEVLRFDNLDQYLLLKNGNYLYKVPFRDGWAVLKLYYGTRSQLTYLKKTCTNILYSNRSSHMPKDRRRTELACLNMWRDAGFRVFEVYEDVVVEGMPEDAYLLLEYSDATRFIDYFPDQSVPLQDKVDMWRRFCPYGTGGMHLAIERTGNETYSRERRSQAC